MKKRLMACLFALNFLVPTMAQTKTIDLRIVETSDVHGCFFPIDFINRKPMAGTLARVTTYVDSLRNIYGKNLILLDNGDILQGQPTCYYYNFVKTDVPNIAASIINFMGYDAENVGNHDIETGHDVYDKWIKDVKCPVLGANIIDTKTEKPYLTPYKIIERDGIKIAILGMITPAIPNWLKESLWSGLRFDEIIKSSNYWIKYLKTKEKPDVIIGMFHSGKEGGITTDKYVENVAAEVASKVPGFDIVLFGHDHTRFCQEITNVVGEKVVCIDPSCHAKLVGDAKIRITMEDGKVIDKSIVGDVVDITRCEVSNRFMQHFKSDIDNVNKFVNQKIGTFKRSMYTSDSFFGSSAFSDLILNLQLQITGADISFNAPLSFNACIKEGDIHVSDMFNLYKYENQIYVMRLTGEEIRKHLEMSYDMWCNTMKSPDDHLLLLNENSKDDQQRIGFKNLYFNFDSAAGIDYEVDVTKPNGQKVRILKMSNGKPFDEKAVYKVAVNSYRGNGGGELLTRGAGIPQDKLKERIIYESEKDQRYYLMKEIEKAGTMDPKPNNNWRFVPEKWVKSAAKRDRAILFAKPINPKE